MSWERFWKNVRYSLGDGRTLQLSSDPGLYIDADTRRAIRRGANPGMDGAQIAWPVEAHSGE